MVIGLQIKSPTAPLPQARTATFAGRWGESSVGRAIDSGKRGRALGGALAGVSAAKPRVGLRPLGTGKALDPRHEYKLYQ